MFSAYWAAAEAAYLDGGVEKLRYKLRTYLRHLKNIRLWLSRRQLTVPATRNELVDSPLAVATNALVAIVAALAHVRFLLALREGSEPATS